MQNSVNTTSDKFFLVLDPDDLRSVQYPNTYNSREELEAGILQLKQRAKVWGTTYDYKVCYGSDELKSLIRECKKKHERKEVEEYREHVANECERLRYEIETLEQVKAVCAAYDGKVINKRFYDKLAEACGGCAHYDYGLTLYKRNNSSGKLHEMKIYKGMDEYSWRWENGERLEGAAAVAVICANIEQRKANIPRLKKNVSQYAAYLRKVRKLQEEVGNLTSANCDIRNFAREHHLRCFGVPQYIWPC